MVTLYNVVSSDGFIARQNGDEDFIPDELWDDFLILCEQNETVVMGKNTYQSVQEYPGNLIKEFEGLDLRRVVVTRDVNFLAKPGYLVMSSPEDVLALGGSILVSSGPTLNAVFLEKGLVDRVILNILPEKVGSGIKVFENEPNLILEKEEAKSQGGKWQFYRVKK